MWLDFSPSKFRGKHYFNILVNDSVCVCVRVCVCFVVEGNVFFLYFYEMLSQTVDIFAFYNCVFIMSIFSVIY